MQAFSCPACGKMIGAELPAGSRVMCPYCQQIVQMPSSAGDMRAAQAPPPMPVSVEAGGASGNAPSAVSGGHSTGFPPPPLMAYSAAMHAPPGQGAAITSLVLSLVGITTSVLPLGIAGGVVGLVALRRIRREPHRYGGRGMAMAGAIIGGVCLLLTIAAVALMLIFWSALSGGFTAINHEVDCVDNLAQVARALLQYESEFGVYPESLDALVADGRLTVNDVTCPAAAPGATSYHYVPGYTSAAPGSPVIVFDDPNNHGSGGCVMQADGSVVWMDNPAFTALVNSVKAQAGLSTSEEAPMEDGVGETEEASDD